MNKKVWKPGHEQTPGTGNWGLFQADDVAMVETASQEWSSRLEGIEKPWLCWCVNDQWCVLQQKLVLWAGWTPVVGHDTNIESPTLMDGSVYVDFNKDFNYSKMYMHFPMEWVYLFCDRLAFWHSDLLLSFRDMKTCVRIFENLNDGETAAYKTRESLLRFWKLKGSSRFFEVIGCTTRGASLSQFQHGCGWWRNYYRHPNFRDGDTPLPHEGCDHGFGIMHWHKKYGGKAVHVPVSMEGHADANNTRFTISKEEDLENSYSLVGLASALGIAELLNH